MCGAPELENGYNERVIVARVGLRKAIGATGFMAWVRASKQSRPGIVSIPPDSRYWQASVRLRELNKLAQSRATWQSVLSGAIVSDVVEADDG